MSTSKIKLHPINKAFIAGHKVILGAATVIIAIAIVLTVGWTKHFQHPVGQWVAVIAASVLFGYGVIDALYREEGSTFTGTALLELIFVTVLYACIVFGVGTSARTNRQENCIAAKQLPMRNQEDAKKWVDFYSNCPGADMILDEPAKEYILTNAKIPAWLMFKSGITQDAVGWWKYYSGNAKSPYRLDLLTPEEKENFLYQQPHQLPAHTLAGN